MSTRQNEFNLNKLCGVEVMNTIKEVNDLFEQIDQEFNEQEIYGVQYILNDLLPDYVDQTQEKSLIDWYGLADLTIE